MSTLSLTLMSDAAALAGDAAHDERDLIQRFLRQRDPHLFAQLIRPYEAPVHRLVAATLGPRLRLEVEDCVQEILIHVFHKLPAFRFESRFSTWLYRLARNKAIDLHRRPRHRRPHLDDRTLAALPTHEAGPHEKAELAEVAARLRPEGEALREPQRSVVHLFYWTEVSIDEIGELLRLKPATVKSHLFRARKGLERQLESDR